MSSANGANGPVNCVVFDLDGTLLDTRAAMIAAINTVLAEVTRTPVAVADLGASVHLGLEPMLRQALKTTGGLPNEATLQKLDARVSDAYVASAGRSVSMYPHVLILLDTLRVRDTRLAVCTNQTEANARRLLQQFGLTDYFCAVAGRDTFMLHKPHPAPLVWLMGWCRVRPSETLMVGDSELDAQCAHSAGVPVVLMEHGYGMPTGRGHRSLPDFNSLLSLLDPA
jgi:phosphoglycolate phosphatase